MRPDMAKLLVERPRPGSRDGSRPVKGYHNRIRRMVDLALETGDSPPTREGIKARCGGTRWFNENLSPLRRFLLSQVGRPWDRVHSDVSRHIDRGNVVQKHILTHLYDFVAERVAWDGDTLVYAGSSGWWLGRPLADCRFDVYVCPRSGLLKRVKRPPGRRRIRFALDRPKEPAVSHRIRVGEDSYCLQLDGNWEYVCVIPVLVDPFRPSARTYDVVLEKPVGSSDLTILRQLYGSNVVAIHRHRMSRQEQKRYPIPIDLIR